MDTATQAAVCWICGDRADTREHRTKSSDLAAVFGKPSQDAPLYLHTEKRRNIKVGSLKSHVLKFRSPICNRCNSARTQPHDRAWQYFSETVRMHSPPIAAGQSFRANRVFPYDTRRQMRNVHFYFLKLFGLLILEGDLPMEIAPFADALLRERPHPNVYLAFGPAPDEPRVGATNVECLLLPDKRCAFATWFYEIDNLFVNVIYAIDSEMRREGLRNAWHPRLGARRLVMKDFLRVP
jgi:hypothetical protein